MRLNAGTRELRLRRPFVISAGAQDTAHNAFVRLESEGQWGLGEGVPSARVTGTSLEDVVAFLSTRARGLAPAKLGDATELSSEVARTVLEGVVEPGPGPAALDIALLDLAGRAGGMTARELLDLPVTASLPTSITVSLGPVEDMVAEAEEHWRSGFEVLKVKLGRDMISSRRLLAAIKDAVPNAVLRVDANEAWNLRIARTMLPLMSRYEVELVEQPLPRGDHDGMAEVTRASPVPIVADEMVLGTGDVETIGRDRLAHGINIKLQKVGGLSVGARLAVRAKELDLRVMVGCFIESGAGIAAASQLLGVCDWADLDGHLLLDVNPIPGPPVEMGNVSTPPEAGIGHGGSEVAVEALVGLDDR